MRCALALAALVLVSAAAAAPPARVQVTAKEYSFALSRLSVHAGPAVIQLANFGQDAHDLRLQRAGGGRTHALPVVQAGRVADLTATLAPGRYVLWCSIADHRARGMHATLVVTAR